MRLCQEHLLAVCEDLVKANRDANLREVDKGIGKLGDAFMRWQAMRVELADADRDLQEIENTIEGLRDNMRSGIAATDDTGSAESLLYSSDCGSSVRL